MTNTNRGSYCFANEPILDTLSNVFGINLHPHVKNIFNKLGYDNLRSIAMMDLRENREILRIEESVRKIFAQTDMFNLSEMSHEEKIELFGPLFAKAPSAFEFGLGERNLIIAAVKTCQKILAKQERAFDYDLKKSKRRIVKKNDTSSTDATKVPTSKKRRVETPESVSKSSDNVSVGDSSLLANETAAQLPQVVGDLPQDAVGGVVLGAAQDEVQPATETVSAVIELSTDPNYSDDSQRFSDAPISVTLAITNQQETNETDTETVTSVTVSDIGTVSASAIIPFENEDLLVMQPMVENVESLPIDHGNSTNAETNASSSLQKIIKKGKSLDQYVKNWMDGTKLCLDYSFSDCSIEDENSTITCTKCKVRPFNGSVRGVNGWKITTFVTHLKKFHSGKNENVNDDTEPESDDMVEKQNTPLVVSTRSKRAPHSNSDF